MSRLLLLEGAAHSQQPPSTSPSAPRNLLAEIVQLPHPKTGRQARFLCHERNLLELQRVTQSTPCSWFVDQSVQSDGSLLTASRVDPVFLVLPLLSKTSPRFSPVSQYLVPSGPHDTAVTLLQRLDGLHDAMAALCDVNSTIGEAADDLLYKLNREKAAGHLAARTRRLAGVLHAQSDSQQSRLKAAMGSFSAASSAIAPSFLSASSSSAGVSSPSSSSGSSSGAGAGAVASQESLLTALGLMSEYMSDEWTEETAAVLGIPLAVILPHVAKAKHDAAVAQAAAVRRAAAVARGASTGNDGGDDDDDMDRAIEEQLGHEGADNDGSYEQGPEGESSPSGSARGSGALNSSGLGAGGDSPAASGSSNAAAWNAAALDDPSSIVNKYVRPTSLGTGGVGGSASKPKPPVQTGVQVSNQKKLAAAAKGTKSLASFFWKKQ